ncbi:hypothetical protein THAOC_17942, partial [Thalassiosira oceanica]
CRPSSRSVDTGADTSGGRLGLTARPSDVRGVVLGAQSHLIQRAVVDESPVDARAHPGRRLVRRDSDPVEAELADSGGGLRDIPRGGGLVPRGGRALVQPTVGPGGGEVEPLGGVAVPGAPAAGPAVLGHVEAARTRAPDLRREPGPLGRAVGRPPAARGGRGADGMASSQLSSAVESVSWLVSMDFSGLLLAVLAGARELDVAGDLDLEKRPKRLPRLIDVRFLGDDAPALVEPDWSKSNRGVGSGKSKTSSELGLAAMVPSLDDYCFSIFLLPFFSLSALDGQLLFAPTPKRLDDDRAGTRGSESDERFGPVGTIDRRGGQRRLIVSLTPRSRVSVPPLQILCRPGVAATHFDILGPADCVYVVLSSIPPLHKANSAKQPKHSTRPTTFRPTFAVSIGTPGLRLSAHSEYTCEKQLAIKYQYIFVCRYDLAIFEKDCAKP